MLSEVAIDEAQVTLFFWTAAITVFFLGFEAIRQSDRAWAVGYFCASLLLVLFGFIWNSLPQMLAGMLQASADQIYGVGVMAISIVYAFARKRWVTYGDKHFIAGFGEGLVVVSFVTLLMGAFLDEQLFATIVTKFQTQFFVAGGAGLALIYIAHQQSEETGKRLSELQKLIDDIN